MGSCLHFMEMCIPMSIFMVWRLGYNSPQMPVGFGCLVVTSSIRRWQMWGVAFYASISPSLPAPLTCALSCKAAGSPCPSPSTHCACQPRYFCFVGGAQAFDLNFFSGRSFFVRDDVTSILKEKKYFTGIQLNNFLCTYVSFFSSCF